MSEISLTASMRSNLLSLQQIAKLQDSTQLRLSTGLKVNSAIDNPSSYYTASSLNNRAEDLSALLDSMGQGVQTIKAATEGIEKAEDLLSQMKAIAEQVNTNAVEVPEKSYFEKLVGTSGAVVTNAEELRAAVDSGKEEICIYGKIDLGDIATTGSLNLQENQKLVGVNYYGNFGTEGEEFSSITAFSSVMNKSFINISQSGCLISDLYIDYSKEYVNTINVDGTDASVELHNLEILSFDAAVILKNGSNVEITGKFNVKAIGDNGSGVLAIDNSVCNINAGAQVNIEATAIHGVGLWSQNNATININSGANVSAISHQAYGIYMDVIGSTINIMSGANVYSNNISCSRGTLNVAGNVKTELIRTASYNSQINIKNTAQIYFTKDDNCFDIRLYSGDPNILDIASGAKIAIAKNGQAKWYEVKADYQKDTSAAAININANNIETTLNVAETNSWKTVDEFIVEQEEKNKEEAENTTLSNEDDVAAYQTQYNNALSQYDSLIKDSSYKGINLLQADDLKVIFNENRSSTLEVSGVDLSSDKIGMMTADWSKAKDVQNSINQVIEAKNTLRSASTKLGNYYSIITERETFTDNLINVLEEGADKLTLADMNEESANMLSLQTQQQLAINSLSLASQASQAVLRLF